MSVELGSAYGKIVLDASGVQQGVDSASGNISRLQSNLGRVGPIIAGAMVAAGAAIGTMVVRLVAAGSAVEEMVSKFNVVFGQSAPLAAAALEQFAQVVGRSKYELMGMAASVQDTFVPLGFARETAAALSVDLVKLATDVASFNNAVDSEVLANFQSALVGNHEAVRAYGIVITEAALNAELMRMGITGGTQAASEQEKVMARLNLILAGTTDAQGDAERTADGFANQMRGLRGAVSDTAADIGLTLIPVLSPLVGLLREIAEFVGPRVVFIFQWLTGVLREHGATIGIVVLALAAGIGAFLLVANAGTILAGVVGLLTTAWGLLAAAIGFVLSPIGLVAVAIGALVALFVLSAGSLREKVGGAFSGLGSDMASFGQGIILAFAEGMASAIGAVLDVLIAIGNLIAQWLMPGSPPKILPEIDAWGTEAMNEYLGGFAAADFGVFDQLTGTLEQFMRGVAGGQTSEGLVQDILGMREAVAAAVSEFSAAGEVSEAAFQRIFESMGTITPEVEGYVRALIELESANRAVQEAQDELNGVTEAYDAILSPLNEQLAGVRNRQQEIRDQQRLAQLQEVLNNRYASAADREEAALEMEAIRLQQQIRNTEAERDAAVGAAEEKLSTAEAEQEAAQAQFDQTSAMLGVQQDNIALLNEQTGAMGGAAGAAGGLAERLGGAGGAMNQLHDAITQLGGSLPSIGEGIGTALDGWKAKFVEFADGVVAKFEPLKAKFQEVGDTWANVFIGLFGVLANASVAAQQLGQIVGYYLFGSLTTASTAAQQLVTSIGLVAEWLWGVFVNALTWAGTLTEQFGQIVIDTAGILIGLLLASLTNNTDALTHIGQIIVNVALLLGGMFYNALTVVGNLVLNLATFIGTTLFNALTIVKDLFTQVATIIGSIVILVFEQLWLILDTIAHFIVDELVSAIVQGVVGINAMIDSGREARDIIQFLFDTLVSFWQWLQDHILDLTIQMPEIPDWAIPGSPIPLHTAWKNFHDFLGSARFVPNLDIGPVAAQLGALQQAAVGTASGGNSSSVDNRRSVANHNNFALNIQTNAGVEPILQDFFLLQSLVGGT